eukprot:332635-Amphidinium_carterae.1
MCKPLSTCEAIVASTPALMGQAPSSMPRLRTMSQTHAVHAKRPLGWRHSCLQAVFKPICCRSSNNERQQIQVHTMQKL